MPKEWKTEISVTAGQSKAEEDRLIDKAVDKKIDDDIDEMLKGFG